MITFTKRNTNLLKTALFILLISPTQYSFADDSNTGNASIKIDNHNSADLNNNVYFSQATDDITSFKSRHVKLIVDLLPLPSQVKKTWGLTVFQKFKKQVVVGTGYETHQALLREMITTNDSVGIDSPGRDNLSHFQSEVEVSGLRAKYLYDLDAENKQMIASVHESRETWGSSLSLITNNHHFENTQDSYQFFWIF